MAHRPTLTDADILAQIPAARERARTSGGVAVGVRYRRTRGHLEIALASGATLLIPAALVPALHGLTRTALSQVVITTAGMGLSWERAGVDLSVAGLAQLALGRHTLLRAAGAAGGSARSPAKTRASRLNGRRGGRPRGAGRPTSP